MTKRVNRPYRKLGRKSKEPSATTAARIHHLAATGHSIIGIARGLNVAHVVLSRWLDAYPELAEALKQGREAERFALHDVLYRAARKGNIVAAMFLLKARHGYREGDQADTANRVSIQFTLPGAIRAEDFKVIDHEPTTDAIPVPEKSLTRS